MKPADQFYFSVHDGETEISLPQGGYKYETEELSLYCHGKAQSISWEELGQCIVTHGLKAAKEVDGKYFIVLHDKKEKKILAVRDPMDSMNAYVTSDRGITLSSDISTLLETRKEIKSNIEELRKILLYRSPGMEQTCFSGIGRVLASHIMEYDETTGYLSYVPVSKKKNKSPTLEELDQALDDAVRQRAGEKTGILLSSGIDSVLILSYLLNTSPLQAYSTSFGHARDETSRARKIAMRMGAPFKTIDITATMLDESLSLVNQILEEPCGNPAHLATYIAASQIQGNCDTLLLGDEADELFLGYEKYLAAAHQFDSFNLASFFAERMPFDLETLKFLGIDSASTYFEELASNVNMSSREALVESLADMDFECIFPDNDLEKIGKATGLSVSSPFNNLHVYQVAKGLSTKEKIDKRPKEILRELARKRILDQAVLDIINEQKKIFYIPLELWDVDFTNTIREEIHSSKILQDVVDMNYVKKMYSKFTAYQRWLMISIHRWHEAFFL